MQKRVRIAVLGFRLESNAHAPVCGAEDFDVLSGDALADDLRRDHPHAPQEISSFIEVMTENPGVDILPISVAAGGASGPVDQVFFEAWLDDAVARTRAAGPFDGIYLAQHGAAIATGTEDPDGDIFEAFRKSVGNDTPIVTTFDPHANISEKMVANSDVLIAYQTNPHVDQHERGVEAAHAMRELLAGVGTTTEFVKIPMIPPSTSQVTKTGPLGDHVAFGQSFLGDDILAVCVCSGFSVGDTQKAGMSVTVTTRGNAERGREAAEVIAQRIWNERGRYDITMTSLDDAVAMMKAVNNDPARASLCFADVADNPGGGGRGNTTYILRAFLEADCKDALLGPFHDPALAREATDRGVGAEFEAKFNRDEASEYSKPLTWNAKVLALHDGDIIGRRGISAGRRRSMGKTALLRCDGVMILVAEKRIQFCDPAMVECVGISLADLRGLVVKSRGHFRASVDEVFTDDRIIEVDVPGLTTAMLDRVNWRHVPRPIYPLDRSMEWSANTT